MAGSGETLTYRQLDELSNRGAQLFRKLGLRAGDCIAIFMENNRRSSDLLGGAARGPYLHRHLSRLTAGEVEYIVKDCGAKLFVTSKHSQARPPS